MMSGQNRAKMVEENWHEVNKRWWGFLDAIVKQRKIDPDLNAKGDAWTIGYFVGGQKWDDADLALGQILDGFDAGREWRDEENE